MKEKLQTYDPKSISSEVNDEVKEAFITSSREAAAVAAVKYSSGGQFDEKPMALLRSLIPEVDEEAENTTSSPNKNEFDSGNNNN